jgi:hypothetical protein
MASKAKQLRMKLKEKKIEQEEKLMKEENEKLNDNINNNNNEIKEEKIKLKEISISSSSDENEEKKDSKQKNNNNNNIILVEEEIDPLNYFDVNHINIDKKNPVNEITEEIKKKNSILSKKTAKNSNSDIESKENDFYQSSKLPIVKNKKKKLLKMNTINLLDDNNDNFKNNINKVSNHRTSISFGNMKLSILDLMEAKECLKTNEEVEKTLENLRNSERLKIEEEKKREKEREAKKNILIENENNNNNDELNELDEKKKQIFIDKVNNENIKKTQERIKQLENFSSEEIQNKIDEIKKLKNFKDFEKIKNILLKSELPEFLFENDKDIQIIKENEEIKFQNIKIDIIQLYNNK